MSRAFSLALLTYVEKGTTKLKNMWNHICVSTYSTVLLFLVLVLIVAPPPPGRYLFGLTSLLWQPSKEFFFRLLAVDWFALIVAVN